MVRAVIKFLLPLLLSPALVLAADEAAPSFNMKIERLDPAFDQLIPAGAQLEKCAEGFNWSEGPTWFQESVVFSDVPENVIYQWKPGQTAAAVFMKPSGMLTPTPGFREQGSNGLGVDAQGRLLICQHGERRVARVEKDGSQTALADHFNGKRFSSPNDLALRKNGDLYFTDPPYGLEKLNDSPLKEQPWNGVYRIAADGKVSLVIKDLTFPNGIAFSPDEKILYVAVSDSEAPRIMAYEVQPDGSVANGRRFFDAAPLRAPDRKGSCDGLKVDAKGNLFATGPGGVLVISPEAKHLGTLNTGEATGNCAWGDDGSTLYITADMFLARVKTSTKGAGW
ncbi:MAG: gluconolactonase [Chthoniobacter sp.]|jgi:gluconolactonase|nr:gluconolactonase [Chthoniobacter sp.]